MYKNAYRILKDNMLFIQPILIWQIIFALVMMFNTERIQLFLPKIIMWCCIGFLFTACLSGWLYINKHGLLSYCENDLPEEKAEKTLQSMKKFFEGVGENFFKITIACIVLSIIYAASFFALYEVCTDSFGIPSFVKELFAQINSFETKEQILKFLSGISSADKLIFAKWVIVLNIGISILNFFSVLYLTVLSFEKKNFIISLFLAVKFFILNIFESIGIIIFVFALYLFINILSAFLSSNSLLFALFIILITLYFNYYVLLVFCFYNEKKQINSGNGCECNRENSISDKFGEEI